MAEPSKLTGPKVSNPTEEGLRAMLARAGQATEGPWRDNNTDSWRWPGMSRVQLFRNRHFVAHARHDLPNAVLHALALRKELREILSYLAQEPEQTIVPDGHIEDSWALLGEERDA